MLNIAYCGRFAPSPTGPLHFGSLIAALASYCDARQQGGRWLLRIEDVDAGRCRAEYARAILATLLRYGFRWDDEVVYQSQRLALYEAALTQLRAADQVYRCSCSRQQLQGLPLGASGEAIYPGTCRQHPPATNLPCAWRLKVPDRVYAFCDRAVGSYQQNLAHDCGDFVVKRRDGYFAYHLAVVVDDADQHVTHVVRGADLLSSTPRHLYLYELLAAALPQYLHLPLALTAAGEKLSKQTRAPALPDEPLPSLKAAWQFLRQSPPPADLNSVDRFWQWAFSAWNPRAL